MKVAKLHPRTESAGAVDLAEIRTLLEQLLSEQRAQRVLLEGLHRGREGLERGRAKAIERARKRGLQSQRLIIDLAAVDVRAGKPERGRAGRIARKLDRLLSESQIRKILRTLSSAPDSLVSN